MKNEEEIHLCSDGSGGFLGNLSKAKIFQSWDRANIQFLQIVNLKNFTNKIADPLKLGYIVARRAEILLDVYQRASKSIDNPCISINEKTEKFEFLYPFEVKNLIN